ncbi:hypothetical protein HRI_000184300 [Hibiscus trionum]|uniref:RRM domain-containing protein n=1 Tax=Hibiscus trionum TaxID=183268 RepID=A0A9W7LIZ1_HIBTR|nr:hypothetical protein HRI_000184300 [Hibiscus trionum]
MERRAKGAARVRAESLRSGLGSRRGSFPAHRRFGFAVFISNVSKRIHQNALCEAFSVYGTVLDSYIAYWNPKRQGKQTTFAFVRFSRWSEAKRAVDQGNGRLLDGFRIKVFEERSSVRASSHGVGRTNFSNTHAEAFRDNRSYRDVVRSVKNIQRDTTGQTRTTAKRYESSGEAPPGSLGILIVEDKPENGKYGQSSQFFVPKPSWRSLCLVGRIKPMYNVNLVQDALNSEGLGVQVCPWFGLLAIIRCNNSETLTRCWERRADLIGSWFVELEMLEGYEGKREVKTWVTLKDVPLQVWDAEFFRAVASRWGEFICLDNDTLERSRFDIARILLSVRRTSDIPDKVVIFVNGTKQIIKIGLEDFVEEVVFIDGRSPWEPAGDPFGAPSYSHSPASDQVPRAISETDIGVLEGDKEVSHPPASFNDPPILSAAHSSSSMLGLHDVPIVSEGDMGHAVPGLITSQQSIPGIVAQVDSVSNESRLQEVPIVLLDSSLLVGRSQPDSPQVHTGPVSAQGGDEAVDSVSSQSGKAKSRRKKGSK